MQCVIYACRTMACRYDAIITGEVEAHAAASAAVASLATSGITVGFPTEFFYQSNIPESVLDNEQINKKTVRFVHRFG